MDGEGESDFIDWEMSYMGMSVADETNSTAQEFDVTHNLGYGWDTQTELYSLMGSVNDDYLCYFILFGK
jgi:hypothetical protein